MLLPKIFENLHAVEAILVPVFFEQFLGKFCWQCLEHWLVSLTDWLLHQQLGFSL